MVQRELNAHRDSLLHNMNPYQAKETSVHTKSNGAAYVSTRNRNSSMDSIIPIIVTRDGEWKGAADSKV